MRVKNFKSSRTILISFILTSVFILHEEALAQNSLRESVRHDDFEIQEEMVPMSDGTRLYTLILIP